MNSTFFFYDLETFGLSPKEDRIAQFAGIRTDHNFNIIGEPINLYCEPPEDYIPDPESILITGITPQEAREKGVSEKAFAAKIWQEFSEPNTCILGYNSIRFDDEMIRYLFYRNFIDPYAHHWQNGNSRWDLLDVVRATYAFRPEGIEWPTDDAGIVSFKLENLSKANGLLHEKAHDALSDVYATIAMAKLIKAKQPKLFDYYFQHRRARDLNNLIDLQQMAPLLHASGMFGQARNNLSMIMPLFFSPHNKNELVSIDLMGDISGLLNLDATTIREKMYTPSAELPEGEARIPLKGIHLNKCPILATPKLLKTMSDHAIDEAHCQKNIERIMAQQAPLLSKIFEVYQVPRSYDSDPHSEPVESLLYQGFFERSDRQQMDLIPQMTGEALLQYDFYFHDPRLQPLLFIYRARNYFETLFEDEKEDWKRYILMKREYFKSKYQQKYHSLLKATQAGKEADSEDDRTQEKMKLLASIESEYL